MKIIQGIFTGHGYKKWFFWGLVVYSALWWGGVAALNQHVFASTQRDVLPTQTYTVSRGDTLWSIAVRKLGYSDPRVEVERLIRLNHLNSAYIYAGEKILLPIEGGGVTAKTSST